MTPTSTKKGAKLHRYHVSMDVIRNRETGEETAPMRLAAGMVEDAVVTEVRRIMQTPEVVTQVLAALKRDGGGASEADAVGALHEFNALWSQNSSRLNRPAPSSCWWGASRSPPPGSRSTFAARASRASSGR